MHEIAPTVAHIGRVPERGPESLFAALLEVLGNAEESLVRRFIGNAEAAFEISRYPLLEWRGHGLPKRAQQSRSFEVRLQSL
jgi:hypothetical protein